MDYCNTREFKVPGSSFLVVIYKVNKFGQISGLDQKIFLFAKKANKNKKTRPGVPVPCLP